MQFVRIIRQHIITNNGLHIVKIEDEILIERKKVIVVVISIVVIEAIVLIVVRVVIMVLVVVLLIVVKYHSLTVLSFVERLRDSLL